MVRGCSEPLPARVVFDRLELLFAEIPSVAARISGLRDPEREKV